MLFDRVVEVGLPVASERVEILRIHGLAETDVDDGLSRAVGLGRIVLTISRRSIPATRHAGLAAFQLGKLAHQGIGVPIRELALHLLAHSAVLPPVKDHHEQDEQNAQ